jgi:hypothetical protein
MNKSNTPHLPKTNSPDSDESARDKHPFAGEERIPDASPDIEGLQTSSKAGKHSSVEKLAASRPERGASPGARPVDGAFGTDSEEHPITGRNAAPETNQFRCNACGRYFNNEEDLANHEQECRLAKAATASGRDTLRREDATAHRKNDADK